jgi:hypothetical protein
MRLAQVGRALDFVRGVSAGCKSGGQEVLNPAAFTQLEDKGSLQLNIQHTYCRTNTIVRYFPAALGICKFRHFIISRLLIFNYINCQIVTSVDLYTELVVFKPKWLPGCTFRICDQNDTLAHPNFH